MYVACDMGTVQCLSSSRCRACDIVSSRFFQPQCRPPRQAARCRHLELDPRHRQTRTATQVAPLTSPLLQYDMTAGMYRAAALIVQAAPDRQDQAQSSNVDPEEEDFSIEEELKGRRRKKKGKVTVIAPQVQQAYGGEPTTVAGKVETYYVSVLALGFVVILLEGLFVAVSGFLPEYADQFAQDVVYPAFSPSVGVFLALSTIYGIWKSRQ